MPLGQEYILLLIILFILIGILVSIVGLGGGILIIPISIFILGFSPKEAIVISLFCMTFLTLSASIKYIIKKQVNYRLSVLYNLFDTPGVILGAILTIFLTANFIAGLCGLFIIILSILLFKKKENDYQNPELNINSIKNNFGVDNIYLATLSSFSGGFVTGLVGLGGGTTDTTSMILLGMDPKKAAATSEFGMVFTSILGLIIHLFIGTYTNSWLWPIILAVGVIIGAQIGPHLSGKVNNNFIRKVLACLAFYTGILMILLMFEIGWIN